MNFAKGEGSLKSKGCSMLCRVAITVKGGCLMTKTESNKNK